MNVASSPTRWSALLVETDKGLGLEGHLREHGCAVQRASSRAAALESLGGADFVVIVAAGMSADEVRDIVEKATQDAIVLVVTEETPIAIAAARLGAATVLSHAIELVTAQIEQQLSVVAMKRPKARSSVAPDALTAGQRRSTPLPKEATPDALEALVEAAEELVPMHRFQRAYVDYALRRFGGNKVHTAAALGIDRRTIQRWARARASQPPQAISAPTGSREALS